MDEIGLGYGILCEALSSPLIRRNIITNADAGIVCVLSSFPAIECNNIYATTLPYGGDCTDQAGINGNISVDPEYCGIAGAANYYLQSDSPCARGNHPDQINCGTIGAFGVGCGNTPVRSTSWGALKTLYRKESASQ